LPKQTSREDKAKQRYAVFDLPDNTMSDSLPTLHEECKFQGEFAKVARLDPMSGALPGGLISCHKKQQWETQKIRIFHNSVWG
jgi:hypothetical protein